VEEVSFSKVPRKVGWCKAIPAAHSERFVALTTKATKKEEIANLDEEHSREDLTQGFSATCNPGPLCEPPSSSPNMSELPSHNRPPPPPPPPPCCDAFGTHLPSNAVNSDYTSSRDGRSKEGLQGNGKGTECQASEQPRWIWIQSCTLGSAPRIAFERRGEKYLYQL
jgi:hypothetical protein